jgi:glycosyltransferase involved in cell wall biosynthesis
VLKALKELSNNSIAVCFMGDPTKDVGETYLSFLKNQVIEFGLEEQVYFRSFRKDIATFFSAVDATIMASKSETFGMVTIESMACGTPVIASNAGGSPEILDWGRLGLLFEPENAISLARKIDMFCKEPNSFSLKSLKEEALKYSHVDVCEKVEMVLGIR